MGTVEERPSAPAVTITACLAALLGLYSAFAVATFWGALGGLGGGFGAWISLWVLRQRPGIATRVIAAVALVVNALAFTLAALIILFALAE
jgi:hypothetical protein